MLLLQPFLTQTPPLVDVSCFFKDFLKNITLRVEDICWCIFTRTWCSLSLLGMASEEYFVAIICHI